MILRLRSFTRRRVGTPAAEMEDNVPMEVKKQRLYRLNELINELAGKTMRSC